MKKEKEEKKKEKERKTLEKIEEEPLKKAPIQNFVTLKDIDLTVKKGEFVAIVGDIGSGKTSMLKTMLNEMINV